MERLEGTYPQIDRLRSRGPTSYDLNIEASDKPDYHEQPIRGMKPNESFLATQTARSPAVAPALKLLESLPEEQIWLASQLSERTRRAYKQDVNHFIRTMGISYPNDLRHADPVTTKLYDRRGYNPEKSASFFAIY